MHHDDSPTGHTDVAEVVAIPGLIVDRATFTVQSTGKSCFLGNRMPFRLIERLARARGTFLSISRLIQDVWGDREVDKGTVQRTVSILRAKLREAGMDNIIIDGSQPDHYRLLVR